MIDGRMEKKIVAIASGDGLPIAVPVESASSAECRLVQAEMGIRQSNCAGF